VGSAGDGGGGAAVDHSGQLDPVYGVADVDRGVGGVGVAELVDHQRLSGGDGGPVAGLGHAGGPDRAPADVFDRSGGVRGGVVGGGVRAVGGSADRGACGAGGGRGGDDAGHAGADPGLVRG